MVKRSILYIGILLGGFCLQAQTITTAEYFFDADPGIGNATSFSITSGTSISESVSVNVDALSLGFHTLGVRVQQDEGKWSQTRASSFYKFAPVTASSELVAAEYFFDTDPGQGNANALSITKGNTVNSSFTVDASALESGFHTLTVRVQDDLGQWSVNHSGRFYVITPPETSDQIVAAEYYLDTDPGLEEATALSITNGTALNQSFSVSVEGLVDGFHTLTVRTKNELGLWSTNHTGRFFVFTPRLPSDLVALEYYFDEDPGIGLGQSVAIESLSSLDSTFVVNVSDTLSDGNHTLFVRAKDSNGIYSFQESRTFEVIIDPIIDDFFPKEGGVGTQVSIIGSNFSDIIEENTVKFGEAFATNVLYASADSLVVTVPDDASGIVPIEINIGERIGVSDGLYNVDVAVAEGLIAYYPFNENANDESGNGNDGTVNGATLTIDRFGEVNSAYSFDGVDDIILADPLRPSLNTLSAWINPTNLPSGQFDNTVFTVGDGVDDRLNINISNNYVPAYAIEFTNLNTGIGSNVSVSPSDWALVTATYDGDFIRIYVNGVLSGESQVGTRTINYSGVDILGIGDDGVSNNPPFRGTLDDIRIYNRALTIEEIKELSADRPQEAPEILNQSFSVAENRITGTAIGTVAATDVNNDPLSFEIISGNTGSTFMLVDSTGVLLVNDPEALDFEVNPSFTLEVAVSDGIATSQAVITITVTDVDENGNQPPQLLAETYVVKENRIHGLFIARLPAGDPDGDPLSFSILSGNIGNAFLIDEDGNLITNNEDALDFETNPQFDLLVRVSDGQVNVDETINIVLQDVDESVNQAPQANNAAFSVLENSINGTVIGTLLAGDPDGDNLIFDIITGNSSGTFSTDNTGQLSVLDSTALDFELNTSIEMEVTISDGALTIARDVIVNIQDVVENVAPTVANPLADLLLQDLTLPTEISISLESVFSDDDDDQLHYQPFSSNNDVTVEVSDGSLVISNVEETTITVIATDGIDEVEDEFLIEINQAPVLSNPIPDQELIEGFASISISLLDVFTEVEGEALSYRAESSDESVISVSISEDDRLIISEQGLGFTRVTVSAVDTREGSIADGIDVSVEMEPLSVLENSFAIYPNPSLGVINIKLEPGQSIVSVTNIEGREVKYDLSKGDSNEMVIDITKQSDGIYFLNLTEEGKLKSIKIIKTN